jgi:uncharacterized membrane protein YidH (DUF202 family)
MTDLDQMIEDFARERRHRMVLVVAAVIGIVAGALIGIGASLQGLSGAGGARNPGMLVFFVAPFMAAMAVGYAIYGLLRWRASSSASLRGLPRATMIRR